MSMQLNEAVAVRLKAVRLLLNKTQSTFAADLNVSLRTYSRLESGERSLPLHILVLLRRLGFSPDWMLIGRGEMRLPPVKAKDASLLDVIGLPRISLTCGVAA